MQRDIIPSTSPGTDQSREDRAQTRYPPDQLPRPIAYLDNNATTIMPHEVIAEMVAWTNCGNPSAAYKSALKCREMIAGFHSDIARYVGAPLNVYDIIFTSGATEANNMIIRGIIECARESCAPFHVACSAIEHDSIRLLIEGCAQAIPQMKVTIVNPDITGHISANQFARAIRANTVLAICMLANNETGAINNIAAIGAAIKSRNARTFFHCDIVQGFAKIPVNLMRAHVDGASISFHKIHGPPGVGAAIARKDAFCARGCRPLLYGMQNNRMRGGTENVPGIGASRRAAAIAMRDMAATARHELALKHYLIAKLREHVPTTRDIVQYTSSRTFSELEIVTIWDSTEGRAHGVRDSTEGRAQGYLPGTLMLSAAKHLGPPACNTLIKEHLETVDNVIVSIGSACNTGNATRSHVLVSMGVPALVMDGSIRVSFCAQTTREEIDRFVIGFLREVKRQYEITLSETRKK